MDPFSDITDDEIVPFLNTLGAETYKKSFEWMLKDPDFGGILKWLYCNLDQNNALNAREEYRYSELEKNYKLLSPEDLEEKLLVLEENYQELPLPGDKESLRNMELDISFLKERLSFLEREKTVLDNLIEQNELSKQDLSCELFHLSAAQSNCADDEKKLKENCMTLSQEVQGVTEEVVMVIADVLTLYGNTGVDLEISKKFLAFGPFEAYRQSQAIFRSHFDLYCSRRFRKRQMDNISSDAELKQVLSEAKEIEHRLAGAILAYIDSKAELSGELAKLTQVEKFEDIHPSQILAASLEAKTALEMSEQEECIVEQQLQIAVKAFVDRRTKLIVDTAVRSVYSVREEIHQDLSWLLDICQTALSLDSVLYYLVRHELRTVADLIQFATDLKDYLKEEQTAVASRIDSMNTICSEQEISLNNVQQQDPVLKYMSLILGIKQTNDVTAIVKAEQDLMNKIKELRASISEAMRKKEMSIVEFKKSTQPLLTYLSDGCTKQPNARPRAIAALAHQLKHEMDHTDKRVMEASGLFTSVKDGDNQNLRKLWQWFLTNQNKFMSIVKETEKKSFS